MEQFYIIRKDNGDLRLRALPSEMITRDLLFMPLQAYTWM